jgi:nucleotide-binding universal stress UspA family protein
MTPAILSPPARPRQQLSKFVSPAANQSLVRQSLTWNVAAHALRLQIRTIVVPLDGTLVAEQALPHALAIARRSGASLRLVHAHSGLESVELGYRQPGQVKQHYLTEVARRVTRVDNVPVETILLSSTDPVEALVRGASGADLVVLASRRRNLASRLWSNSTFDELRKRLPIPLQLVRGHSSPVDWTADPLPRHILVPLDGSLLSQSVLNHAAAYARLEGAALTLLNIQNEAWTRGFFEHTNPHDYLRTVLQILRANSSFVEAHVITTDRSPAQAIATFAAQHDVDLIALATRADAGLSRVMRGSIADALIRQTDIPVLVRNFDPRPQRHESTTVS